MWWIIIGIVGLVAFAFIWLFVRGADLKNCNTYARMVEDEQQKKALAQINKKKNSIH